MLFIANTSAPVEYIHTNGENEYVKQAVEAIIRFNVLLLGETYEFNRVLVDAYRKPDASEAKKEDKALAVQATSE